MGQALWPLRAGDQACRDLERRGWEPVVWPVRWRSWFERTRPWPAGGFDLVLEEEVLVGVGFRAWESLRGLESLQGLGCSYAEEHLGYRCRPLESEEV